MSEQNIPKDLRYTEEHEWIREVSGDVVRIGITDYAQDQLGDIVFVQLPERGAEVTVGDSFAEVESTKSVSDIYGPVAGSVSAVNEALESSPELVNTDPYGEGWLVEITLAEGTDVESVLDASLSAEAYAEVVAE